jgi:4'-phosphopantetheinyl transferase
MTLSSPIAVDVFSVDVFYSLADTRLPGLLPGLLDRLDAQERERALRFVREQDRQSYALAHALLASVLRANGISTPCFLRGPFGKPKLKPQAGTPPLRFNLTHTDGLAACAIARGYDVGVDAETVDRPIDHLAIANDCFAPSEQAALGAATDRAETFFAFWTLKESLSKAIGSGLSLPLQEFAFTLDPLTVSIAAGQSTQAGDWHLERHAPSPRHRLALAVRRPSSGRLSTRWIEIDPAALVERAEE